LDPQFISVCEEFNLDSTTIALAGGEDYELLFTINQDDYNKIKGNPSLTVIGHITDAASGAHIITRGGEKIALQAQGWKSF
jgi:thiamine-monophosphate kinase